MDHQVDCADEVAPVVNKSRPSKRASVILLEARDQGTQLASANASADKTLGDLEALLASLKASPLLTPVAPLTMVPTDHVDERDHPVDDERSPSIEQPTPTSPLTAKWVLDY